jgi:hypothetical protein
MDDLLNMITGLTARERKQAICWVASLPEERIIDIFQNAVKKAFQIRNERPELSGKIGKYCAFILAVRKAGWDTLRGKGYRVAAKEQYDDFSHMRKAKAAQLIQRGRTPILRKKILAYWGEVKELRAEGIGFRPIAEYLRKNRKLQISASYLLKLWKQVENT